MGRGRERESAVSIAAAIASNNAVTHKDCAGIRRKPARSALAAFSGQTVGSSSLLVRYTLNGDANLDGFVNSQDFTALAGKFQWY